MSTAQRIVSLLPSATEIICALGAQDRLVGRSHECDVPAAVQQLPVCSQPRADMHGSSVEIDGSVRDLVRQGLSVFEVLTEELRQAKPDLIVTQVQCEVCAVSYAQLEAALSAWTGDKPAILSLEPKALRDVFADIQNLANALQLEQAGERLRAGMREQMRAIDGTANGIAGAPTVVCLEWIEPLMAAGNWVPELVDFAGGDNRLGKSGEHSPWIEWSQVLDVDPDVLVIMPCGFDLQRTTSQARQLLCLPGYQDLNAVRCDQVFAVDGHNFFNRPGPRLVQSLEILAELFHPERFDFGHAEHAWTKLPSQ
jgi:iron complex transport system substrate-binding protein